ncbi:MAG: sugar transferase [Flavobacteriia bacterium]|nr:sugar transferase [Flavobacteriia bacterium]
MAVKNLFDFLMALLLLPFLFPIIFILIVLSTVDTAQFGLFTQTRIGKDGKPFLIFKVRTMKGDQESDITTLKTHKITAIGNFIRKTKLDELPQLFNVLFGQMSFVGPRPDVPGYADQLKGDDRLMLKVRPGITGPAQLKFRNEEEILNLQDDPKKYNDEVLWPEKVKINLDYVKNRSFGLDLKYIADTIFKF